MKDIGFRIAATIIGLLLVLLVNTTPLARLGLTINLPIGWKTAPISTHSDASCSNRHLEGIPFAFKRPNAAQSCTFDKNKLALTFNAAVGAVFGLIYIIAAERHWRNNEK